MNFFSRCVLVICGMPFLIHAFDGQLDVSFGVDGRQLINFGFGDDSAHAVVIRHDGVIVAGGSADNGMHNALAMSFFDTNGTLLATNLQSIVPDADHVIRGLAVQPDNKVVAVGSIEQTDPTLISLFIVVRYTADGMLDPTFNAGGATPGVQVIDVAVDQARAHAVAFKRDGRIVVVGQAQDADQPMNENLFYAVALLNEDGTMVGSFGDGGVLVLGPDAITANLSSSANAVAIQAIDDQDYIILAGFGQQDFNGQLQRFQLVRVTCDGELDSSFGANGVMQILFEQTDPANEVASGVDVYPDGRIMAVGTSVSAGAMPSSNMVLARVQANGALDASFSGDGRLIFNRMPVALAQGNALIIQNDLKPVIAGCFDETEFIMARFQVDGTADASFGNEPMTNPGSVLTDFDDFGPNSVATATALALQSDGKLVAVGSAAIDGDPADVALARYDNDNSMQSVFVVPTIEQPATLSNCATAQPTFSGQAQNPSHIAIYIDGVLAGRVMTTGTQNSWSFTPAAPLATGSHTIRVVAEYMSGNMNVICNAQCCAVGLGPQSCISEAIRKKYCPSCMDFPIGCS